MIKIFEKNLISILLMRKKPFEIGLRFKRQQKKHIDDERLNKNIYI